MKDRTRQPDELPSSLETPRILAIADVHLAAPAAAADAVARFYTELIGLDPLPQRPDAGRLAFRGAPRAGPRLIVSILDNGPDPSVRRQLLVQVASLFDRQQALEEQNLPFDWSCGWSFYDRRLCVADPAGNRVELVAYHPF